jgi:hypothetical protein
MKDTFMQLSKIMGVVLLGTLLIWAFAPHQVLQKWMRMENLLAHRTLAQGRIFGGFDSAVFVFTELEAFETHTHSFQPYAPFTGTLSLDPTVFNDHFVALLYIRVNDPDNAITLHANRSDEIKIHYEPATPIDGEMGLDIVNSFFVLLQVEKPKHPRDYSVQLRNDTTNYKEKRVYIP